MPLGEGSTRVYEKLARKANDIAIQLRTIKPSREEIDAEGIESDLNRADYSLGEVLRMRQLRKNCTHPTVRTKKRGKVWISRCRQCGTRVPLQQQ